ncbi:diphosphomevalonate decarboxylase, partial [Candidatus Woesearchaeota archaeon]|nr:diphosphomevalonate decarboxylase [Candidatus Woesearchaeota archaeon]
WGKRDSRLFLPYNSSISMTLDCLNTHTTVEFDGKYKHDAFFFNGKELSSSGEFEDVRNHLERIRKVAKIPHKAKVASKNNFPTAAGLASSASGLAALTLAGTKAAGLSLSKKDLSVLARQGSGSASRSIEGGFVEWLKGQKPDGLDSYAVQIAPPGHWDFRIITVITTSKAKKVKSRSGMAQTVATSPYYKGWLETVEDDLKNVREGILRKNFKLVGETAEHNCLKMHATMITTKPPIIYWNAATMDVIHSITGWREAGLESYFTMDAGPQVKVMCMEKDVAELKKKLSSIRGVESVIVCRPGEGARVVEKHLF